MQDKVTCTVSHQLRRLMGRGFANAYKAGSRPYGQPTSGKSFRESTPRPESVGSKRNVHQVAPTPVAKGESSPEATKCSSLTRSGEPCKGRPASGSDLCNFHRK